MYVIQIGAGLHDQAKLLECAATLGPAGFVGRQIPGNDRRSKPWLLGREDSATPQVSRLIDDHWRATLEVRVPARRVFRGGAGRVADIAEANRVHQVTA